MHTEKTQEDPAAARSVLTGSRLSRRQAMGRMGALATAGAAAWVVPEILTAKPAAGATLSSPGVVTGESASVGALGPPAAPVTSPAATQSGALAFTGLNLQRDAEIGAALLAGGWAMHHWASRTSAPPAKGPGAPA
jgi:hypothetical protein